MVRQRRKGHIQSIIFDFSWSSSGSYVGWRLKIIGQFGARLELLPMLRFANSTMAGSTASQKAPLRCVTKALRRSLILASFLRFPTVSKIHSPVVDIFHLTHTSLLMVVFLLMLPCWACLLRCLCHHRFRPQRRRCNFCDGWCILCHTVE